MSVSDEAVEAAARVMFKAQTFNDWETLDQKIRRIWIRNAQKALEAAAPHLTKAAKAEAWEEGYEQADHDAPHAIKSDNPYKKDGAE